MLDYFMSGSGYGKRYSVLILGLFFMGLGISLITKSSLGTPPISSIPFVLCLIYPITFGQLTFVFSLLFMIGEIILLGRNFPKDQYPQIFVGFFLGLFVDLGMIITTSVQPAHYLYQIVILLIGCVILALGIYLQVSANVLMNPGEGLVQIIAVKSKIRFGLIKILFDSFLVTGAIIISLVHFGTLNGVREGTVISAGLVGYIIILISAMMNKLNFQTWLSK